MSNDGKGTTGGKRRKRGRGRPRDPAKDEAILTAARDLLERHGYYGLTVDQVAEQAGVAKTTVYRRWSTKPYLVLEAIDAQLEPREDPQGEDPIEDLRVLLQGFYRRLSSTEAGRTLPIIAAELLGDEDVAAIFRDRILLPVRRRGLAILDRAEGRLRDGVDPAVILDALAAPAIYLPIALGEPADPARADQIFDAVMGGALRGD